jgi:1,4-dihydroxy-2-naphthoyl-CoA hydrolase
MDTADLTSEQTCGMSDEQIPPPLFETYDDTVAEAFKSGVSISGIPEYLGIRVTDVGPGTMSAELEVRSELLNPFGSAHGGTAAALVDHVLGAVLYPLIPRGAWAATTEMKLNFLAPVREGILRAHAQVIALTKRTAVVRIDVTNQDRLVGAAQGTVTISEPRHG